MAIYGVEGRFGSGKTSYGAYVAKNHPETHIWTNVPMNTFQIKNYHFFEDDKFLEVFRTINLINDVERLEAGYKVPNNSLIRRKRGMFSRHIIIFDEIGSIRNNTQRKNYEVVETEYINTQRKNFTDVYLVGADGQQADKSLRRFCERWFYAEPLWDFPMFRDFKVVRVCKKDSEGKICMKYDIGRNAEGYEVKIEIPEDYYADWFYQPLVWSYYDDLYKNIKDIDKRKVNFKHLQEVFLKNPVLFDNFKNNFPQLYEPNKDFLDFKPDILCID